MRVEDWIEIYSEMRKVFERDKELTHIELTFNIKPVESEYILFLTERQAKQEQRKYSLLSPHLEYTLFYDEYYEYTEYN